MDSPQNTPQIRVLVNGEWQDVPAGITIGELLRRWGLAEKPVAVERNLQVVPRTRHEQTTLSEGDRLEIVTLVGGG
ncbi:sulfur carrier protein ThiS [Thermogutta sp.]|uniref:sulfur carrier protein ThiS n=1 Tax=Thermogutta sp. TaxID=1962930 RepID=UPI0025FB34BF|nr:sulfur carrier protein ThiS [Thermogutta sp.]